MSDRSRYAPRVAVQLPGSQSTAEGVFLQALLVARSRRR